MNEIVSRTYRRIVENAPIGAINVYYKKKTLYQSAAWTSFPIFFIHTPKAAGTSICAALNMPDSSHLLFGEMRAKVRLSLAKKPCFMIVRDPIDRLVSTYFYAIKLRRQRQRNLIEWVANFETPEGFLREIARNPSVRTHYFIRPASKFYDSAVRCGAQVDVFPFDDVNYCVRKYLEVHGIEVKSLPKKNVSEKVPYKNRDVSGEILESVMDIFSDDYLLLRAAREKT